MPHADTSSSTPMAAPAEEDLDVLIVGAGIMSTTLALMLRHLQPEWRICIVEAADAVGTESSAPWNNAGTGHSGYCELNYMPDPADPSKAEEVCRQFLLSRQWWSFLARAGDVEPDEFIHSTPHVSFVSGASEVDYLRRRAESMQASPFFASTRFTQDREVLGSWLPLMMRGRSRDEAVAATWHPDGTDVDYGALATAQAEAFVRRGACCGSRRR